MLLGHPHPWAHVQARRACCLPASSPASSLLMVKPSACTHLGSVGQAHAWQGPKHHLPTAPAMLPWLNLAGGPPRMWPAPLLWFYFPREARGLLVKKGRTEFGSKCCLKHGPLLGRYLHGGAQPDRGSQALPRLLSEEAAAHVKYQTTQMIADSRKAHLIPVAHTVQLTHTATYSITSSQDHWSLFPLPIISIFFFPKQ